MTLRRIRNQYISQFLLIAAIMGIGSAFALYANYALYRESQKEELVREAYASNMMLEAVLGEASRILDVARPKIEQAINSGTLSKESAYQILKDSHAIFNSLRKNTSLQLAVYIDENGIVQATSAGAEEKVVSLTERLYFITLKNNPKLEYAIGNLVVAKTTGLLTFHIATPVVDRFGKFRGVITQQVAAEELADHLAKSLKSIADTQILVNLNGGDIAFSYPKPVTQSEINFRLNLHVNKRAHEDGKGSGVVNIGAVDGITEHCFVGYATSNRYGLITTVSLPAAKVMSGYLKGSSLLITIIVLAFLALAEIISRFYRKALVIAESLTISLTDTLTGLKNRRFFDTEFPKYWKEALRTKQPISTLFIDIDHFKIFNDDYGHDCGDQALIAVAKVIQKCVSRPLDFCCRWGGEEFAVVLPNTSERGAVLLAEQILAAVRAIQLNFPDNKFPKITVSIGIASMTVNEANKTDDLIDMADKAMYIAKQGGRDKYAVFDEPLPSLES